MIARQKDTGFGWKLEDFEFRAPFTIVQHLHFLEKNLKIREKKTYIMPMHMSFKKTKNSTISNFL
jgi:hypothetical protein